MQCFEGKNMKKRRPRAKNSLQNYSYTHERFPTKAKSIHDSKGRSFKQSYSKLQRNDEYCDNTSCLKKDAFGSLESLFDVKKPLNLSDVFPFALHYHQQKLIKTSNATKSEPFVKALFLQSFSSQTNIEPFVSKAYEKHDRVKVEQNTNNQIKKNIENEFLLEVSKSVELQLNDLIHYQQNRSVNMAENEIPDSEVQAEEEKEATVGDTIVDEESAAIEDLKEQQIETKEDDEAQDKDKNKTTGDKTNDEDEVEKNEIGDEDKIEEIKIDEIREDKADDEIESIGVEEVTKSEESVKSIEISAPVKTDDIIIEVKVMNERFILLTDEVKQLKCEVFELSEKPELTEEDKLAFQEKQDILTSKVAELEELTQKIQKAREEVERLRKVEEETEIKKRDIEPFKKILEEDYFEIPQIQYPEDKLPRVIVCGYTDVLPKLVVADTERKGREKCFEKLTGKLTESLTMQEKLVKENAQLEGGKYKLEEALLEKDTALESLQKKVCGLQAEMRIIVKENMELSRQLATLNQLVIRPTCCYTCPGITAPSSPSTSPTLSSRPHVSAQPRDNRCKCCLRSPYTNTLSPTTESACNSPRLTGGGSPTEERYLADSNDLQNVEMCCRGPAVVKSLLPRGTCPAELEDKLTTYGNSTKQLEQQLGSMETEVRNMQMELANVQRERQQLEQQRKLLKCTGPCASCACCPPPTSTSVTPTSGLPLMGISKVSVMSAMPLTQTTTQAAPLMCTGSCTNAAMGPSSVQQLSDLREQYARLQDDYKSKLCEVSCMRTEAEKFKQDLRDAKEEKERMEIKLIDVQERLKFLEIEKGKFEGHKEHLIEQEQALMVAKQRFREAQDELEELRSLIQDQSAQLEDYRNKYLQAQQQVEEQRRQLDLMEMDNARMNENVTLEIGRVKNQFQEKLAELAPLPDILKQMQMKMQEAQQMRLVAERSCEDLSRELLGCKDKIQTLHNQLDVLRTEHQALQDERGLGSDKSEELEKKLGELRHENERMKNTLARFEEHETQLQKRIDEKMHENTQLSSMLEQIREDSARQVARTKERCETMRRSMQGQIAEMERQLAQCRATARAAQRDRDEIRQKMQSQINNLNEAFKHAQGRIKSLQGHVNYLKTSYSNIFLGQGETPTSALPVDDSCDCNY
ncbi:PREDICTED: myosin-2 heavy chain isoform X1 [Trachymyrmex septentrionalis]|uniref:myosin-2 heavy chain isoform X1 n=2 Tax=Trachymyrmex septentrionalis TaxID=34720 RepID=UPI00084F7426|nr:PREDICTED: myosin-2 heavy chain isoform X1 [Trachymyrmex septentrionalis]